MAELMAEITPAQYAADAGISLQAATKRVNVGRHPGIAEVKKWSRFFVLVPAKDYFDVLAIKRHKKIKVK
jgi:hypothetical protein